MKKVRKCIDCNKPMNFKEFCRDNPSLSEKRAREFWNNQIFSIHCPCCFFNRLEKPFKVRRGYYRYKFRNWKK